MFRNSTLLLLALTACSIAPAFQPAEPFKPGKLSPTEQAALEPGLTLRFFGKGDHAKPIDARRVRLAALHIPQGTPPSPFLPAGPVEAKITGYLKNPLKGDYRFRLIGAGTIVLRINDKEVLRNEGKEVEVELSKNYNRIEIFYTSPPKGDSTMRLDWAGEKFGFEPVPPDALFSRKDDADLVANTATRVGRELYANLHCASCHALPNKLRLEDCAMPEMQSKAPTLDLAGQRFRQDWLAAWMLNPHSFRPEATMPSVLTGADAEKQAADIAAFLVSLKSGADLMPIGSAPKAAEGEAIFKKLGCVTCHRTTAPTEKDDLARLSLHFVAAKYHPHALAHFLKEPHKRYAWTRMPDFRLSDAEAGHLEAYLREQAKGKVDAKSQGDAKSGQLLFSKVGCLNCHQYRGKDEFKMAKDIQSFDKGCLAEKDRGQTPDFRLKKDDLAALVSFLKTDGSSLTRESPAEFSLRQVKALQCNSCHRRDGEITRWHVVLEDDGKIPENLPSLSWVGEKLQPMWTKKLFAGEADHRARPWLKARMPAFPARAETLAVGLSHEHGFGKEDDVRPKPDAKLAAIGEKLIPQQGGFKCNECHGVGKQAAIQPFEAPGINLLDAAIRLRYNYYQRWMLAPDRVDVTMRMPIFATDGKMTQIREVFDGDARMQYDALWQYIQTLPGRN